MPGAVPVCHLDAETFRADACLPLTEAVARGEVRLETLVHGHYPGRQLPHGALPGLKTIGFWDSHQQQSWGLGWHRNEGIELTFLERGTLGFAVDGKDWKLEPDHLTVTRPWQRHRVGDPFVGPGRLHWLILDVGVRRPNQDWRWPAWLVLSEADLSELTTILRGCEQPVWKATADVRRCFQAIAHAVETDRNSSSLSRLTVWINELFVLVLELLRKQKTALDDSLSSTLRAVELFLADLRTHPEHLEIDWSVQQMAAACGLGSTQFIHYVRRLVNMTPAHFLNQCRLEHARRLLAAQPHASITDIALACGFSSSQYFATVFARKYGCPPSQARAGACAGGPRSMQI